jgi:hypothetical protein
MYLITPLLFLLPFVFSVLRYKRLAFYVNRDGCAEAINMGWYEFESLQYRFCYGVRVTNLLLRGAGLVSVYATTAKWLRNLPRDNW